MLSAQGGVEIEVVAEENPDAIALLSIDPVRGLDLETARRWVAEAELDDVAREQAAELLVKLYDCYTEGDCDLAEINPLILTPDGRVHALDAKVTLDDNAVVPPPRVGGVPRRRVRGPAREDGQGEGPQLHRPRRHGRHHRQRRGPRDVDPRRREPGRRQRPRTSSTSAAAPTPTSWPRRSR